MNSASTVILSVSILIFQLSSLNVQERYLLRSSISKEALATVLQDQAVFTPLPKTGDPVWDTIGEKYRKEIIGKGEDAIWRISLTIGLKGLNGSQNFMINTEAK